MRARGPAGKSGGRSRLENAAQSAGLKIDDRAETEDNAANGGLGRASRIDVPRFLVAAPRSGSGKTLVSMGLASLMSRERSVNCFKVGPDYIDPGYLAAGSHRTVTNLDSWLLDHNQVKELFYDRTKGIEIAVVEGAMGLYDGRDDTKSGSSGQIAALLGLPVILVVDASGTARSLAALVRGFTDFDPAVNVAGVFLNRIGSAKHFRVATTAIESEAGRPVIGFLENDEALSMPSRHLGLEQRPTAELNRLAERVAERLAPNIDLERLLEIATEAPLIEFEYEPPPPEAAPSIRIGVARDEAFSFYYQENLELLERLGAELVFFSPMSQSLLPDDIDGLYFGGGRPELYAADLTRNHELRAQIRRYGTDGLPIYAECGGLVYLTESLHDGEQSWPMVGLLPAEARMTNKRQGLGYRKASFCGRTILGPKGGSVRGHEFHWSIVKSTALNRGRSTVQSNFNDAYLYDDGRREGFASDNILASYLHLNWRGDTGLAEAFIEVCKGWRHG